MANIFLRKLHTNNPIICLFFLATTFWINANSARILDEINPHQPQVINDLPQVGRTATLPTNKIPSATGASFSSAGATADEVSVPIASPTTADSQPEAEAPAVPEETPPVGVPVAATGEGADADNIPPVASPPTEENPELPQPEAEVPAVPDGMPVPAAAPKPVGKEPSLSFFLHDILGGSHPSARVVSTDVTALPFSKINNNLYPITGGIPLANPKLNGVVTNNNLPLLVGPNGVQSSAVFQNRGTNNAAAAAGNLPAGFKVQKLMFGSATVIDDQLTEEQESDSGVFGRGQGWYLASSMESTSQMIVLTVLVHGGGSGGGDHEEGVEDTISLFGVHRPASGESEIAVVGGTGKYENARGYAAVERLPKEDEHTTDGVDAVLHFNLYLTE